MEIKNITKNDHYSVDFFNDEENNLCVFVVPNDTVNKLPMYVDFNNGELYNFINSENIDVNGLSMIEDEYNKLHNYDGLGVLVLVPTDLSKINGENVEKKDMFDIAQRIASNTRKVNKYLTERGISVIRNINVIEKNELDIKFSNWLNGQGLGSGVSYNDILSKQPVEVQTITPVQNTELEMEDINNNKPKMRVRSKNSLGFANVSALLVVLMIVAIAGIMIGKYLFDIYG